MLYSADEIGEPELPRRVCPGLQHSCERGAPRPGRRKNPVLVWNVLGETQFEKLEQFTRKAARVVLQSIIKENPNVRSTKFPKICGQMLGIEAVVDQFGKLLKSNFEALVRFPASDQVKIMGKRTLHGIAKIRNEPHARQVPRDARGRLRRKQIVV